MSEPFGDDFDRLTVFDQQSGVGVAQIVEPDLGELESGDEPVEDLRVQIGVERLVPPAGEHVGGWSHPFGSAFFEAVSPLGEDLEGVVVEIDAAPAGLGLGGLFDDLAVQQLHAVLDDEAFRGEVDR